MLKACLGALPELPQVPAFGSCDSEQSCCFSALMCSLIRKPLCCGRSVAWTCTLTPLPPSPAGGRAQKRAVEGARDNGVPWGRQPPPLGNSEEKRSSSFAWDYCVSGSALEFFNLLSHLMLIITLEGKENIS